MKTAFLVLGLTLISALSFAATDDEVRSLIVQESIQSYPGNCPCPYSTMSNGRSCGGRSAYSKPGGRSPLCYPKDVTDQMVQAYRTKHSLK
jgi:hypothetical protein